MEIHIRPGINQRVRRRGAVWQANYFDRYMRDEEQLGATIAYIERNPVSAGLAERPPDWRWSSAYVEA